MREAHYGLEGGAYAALCAVRTDVAKGEDFSEPRCVASNVFNECAFSRNQLAITEKAARDYYASNVALCLVFYGKVLFYPLNRFQIVHDQLLELVLVVRLRGTL
jgi:hypothetical protein